MGTGAFRAKLSDQLNLEISITARYGLAFISTTSGGKSSWAGTPQTLRSGLTLDLDGDGFTNKARFTLTGIPEEPALPDWKRK